MTVLLLFVSVSASFGGVSAYGSCVSKEGRLPFIDTDWQEWYNSSLEFCYANSIVKGVNSYLFNPNGNVTRATFAQMLVNALNADVSNYEWEWDSFSDVKKGSWYAKPVEWAYVNGYMSGTGNGKFSPDAVMTREQLATVFMRYMEKAGYQVDNTYYRVYDYSDYYGISDWALEGMNYAINAGLISGTSTVHKTLEPKTYVTRSQAVRIFEVFMKDHYYGYCNHYFTAKTCEKAGYCVSCGMINGLPNGHICDYLSCISGDYCNECGKYISSDHGMHTYVASDISNSYTCIECGDVIGELSWAEVYLNFLLYEYDYSNYGYDEFYFIYLDNDNIPELYMSGFHAAGGRMCTVKGNNMNSVMTTSLSTGMICYTPKGGRFISSGGIQGYYYDNMYSLINGEFYLYASGEFFETHNSYSDDFYYSYTWDGKNVSERDYNAWISEFLYYQPGDSIDYGSDMSYYEVVEFLYDYINE